MSEQKNIMVSVSMITYNHEKFIAEAIEGVVMQKTDFPFKLVIGEDCSTDSTREICIEYQKKYPDIIRLRLPETNQGMMLNWINNISSGQGKYIALCDGDDYWSDPYKLQKQFDFMEAHPDFALCSHKVHTLMCGHLDENIEMERDVLTTEDILAKDWGLLTASIFFRKEAHKTPDWYYKVKNGDYALQLIVSLSGKIKFLPDYMAVYRQHLGGMSSTLKPLNQTAWMLFLLDEFNKYTSNQFKKTIIERIRRMYKLQIYYAKGYGLRKAAAVLMLYQKLIFVSPFLLKSKRK
ncbi:glycosyltransferase [Dysgonomonas sp. BGC7]|uniref:glycosyltransferase n=1 Tax=Dysgonomonas sp. BGC7 TaxID=1658008 RepID=UPI001F549A7C|nr:glycosyltransferase [Dysgonomonas sp. BGC7]